MTCVSSFALLPAHPCADDPEKIYLAFGKICLKLRAPFLFEQILKAGFMPCIFLCP